MARNKKTKVKKHPKFWFGFKIFLLVFLVALLAGGTYFYFKYGRDIFRLQEEAKQMVKESTDATFHSSETSLVYNNKGKQISVLKGEKDAYYVTIDNIPDYVKKAFIVTEDKKFYEHKGVDFKANLRALVALIKNHGEIKQGASTITQQLARGIFLNQDKKYDRKIKEIFVALELEKKYGKEKILEYYLNTIYFANGYYGIEAAAKGYFSKSCKDLSLSQLAFLCAIPNYPNRYNPLKNINNTIERRNRILDQMYADKAITQEEYNLAINETITLKTTEPQKRNYVETFVTYCATKKIMELNDFKFKYSFDSDREKEDYEEEYEDAYSTAQKQLLNGGYRIYTSIDLKKQKALQKAINENLSGFKDKAKNGVYKMQGAGVCINNKTGRVVAIVGGRSQKTTGYTLNRAYQSFRQPGSCIKPVVVYTPALERDYTPDSYINDHRFSGGPTNSDGSYSGYISLKYAVWKSKNTVAWQIFDKLTPEVGLQYLLDMKFSKIVKSDYYNAASLGGLTYGCSALEMASAYSTIENNGKFRDPTCIVRITDSQGNEIVGKKVKKKYVYKTQAANQMTEILKGVITSGTGAGLGLDNNMVAAAKTGTTNDKKDGWFCGFTPYYTTSIWIGCDNPVAIDDLYGSSYPGKTWQAFMNTIHKGLEPKPFPYEESSDDGSSSSSYSSGSSYSGSQTDYSEQTQSNRDDYVENSDSDNANNKQREEAEKKNKQKAQEQANQDQEQAQQNQTEQGGDQSNQGAADGNAGANSGGNANQNAGGNAGAADNNGGDTNGGNANQDAAQGQGE